MRLFEKTFSVKVEDFENLKQSIYEEILHYRMLYGHAYLNLTLDKDEVHCTIYVEEGIEGAHK